MRLFIRKPPSWLRSDVQKHYGKGVRIEDVNRNAIFLGVLVTVHVPDRAMRRYCAHLQRRIGAVLSRLDIAQDVVTATEDEALRLQELDEVKVRLKCASYTHPIRERHGHTTYWNAKGSDRNLVSYSDKPARTVASGPPCYHKELRFDGAQAVNRALRTKHARISTLIRKGDIKRLAAKLFHQETTGAPQVDVEQVVLNTVKQDRLRHHERIKNQQPTVGDRYPFMDRYRATLRFRVIELFRVAGRLTEDQARSWQLFYGWKEVA